MKQIYLSPPQLAGNEERYLREAIESNWIAPLGPFVDRFEEMLCALTGARHCVALSSGTAALHLGLLAIGIKPGDQILCSDLTFVASANAILYCGATPIFLESERKSWNIDPTILEQTLQRLDRQGVRPAALLPTHLYGMPCAMEEISALCAQWEIPIVEDAAEALGSRYQNRACGTFGAVGALSFNGNKMATTSGGGALLTQSEELAQKVRHLATQARLPTPHYEHDTLGYNYRLSNLLAAVGCAQIEQLEKKIKARRTLYARYADELPHHLPVEEQSETADAKSNRWLSTFLLSDSTARDRTLAALAKNKIEARPCWNPMSRQPLYRKEGLSHPIADELFERGICLPSGIAPDSEEWGRVIEAVRHSAEQ